MAQGIPVLEPVPIAHCLYQCVTSYLGCRFIWAKTSEDAQKSVMLQKLIYGML
jgi:hypothetical protein